MIVLLAATCVTQRYLSVLVGTSVAIMAELPLPTLRTALLTPLIAGELTIGSLWLATPSTRATRR